MSLMMEAYKNYSSLSGKLCSVAKHVASEVLIPKTITSHLLRKYVRKAIQNRVWHKLPQVSRALLYLASKIVYKVKSPLLLKILREIILTIELETVRGKAVYYGTLMLIRQEPKLVGKIVAKAKTMFNKILFLGISYLNNPPIYRIFG